MSDYIQQKSKQSDDKYSARAIVPLAQGGYKQIDVQTIILVADPITGLFVAELRLPPGLYRFAPNGQIVWIRIGEGSDTFEWIDIATGAHQAEPCNPGPGLIRFVEQGEKIMLYSPAPVGTFTWVALARPGDGYDS